MKRSEMVEKITKFLNYQFGGNKKYKSTNDVSAEKLLQYIEETGMLPPLKTEYLDENTGYSFHHSRILPYDERVYRVFDWEKED